MERLAMEDPPRGRGRRMITLSRFNPAEGSGPRLWRYPAALAIVGGSAGVAELFYRIVDTNRISLVFLAGVLVVAVTQGSGPAYLAAFVAFVIYNFYIVEPRYTIEFNSPQDIIVLAIFLAVAMLTGRLAGQVRDEALRAKVRARIQAALFQASREFSSAGEEKVLRAGLARHISEAARGEAAIWEQGSLVTSPEGLVLPPELEATLDALQPPMSGHAATEQRGDWRLRPLLADGTPLGVAAWRLAGPAAAGADPYPVIDVLADLGASAIARSRLAQTQAEIQAEHRAVVRTEQLRDALLSSISHDLRTPLASILASASSLREFGDQFDPAVRDDLVQTIQEEAERLNLFVGNLLGMSRLEAGALQVSATPIPAAELLDRVIQRVARRGGGRRLVRRIDGDGLEVVGDPILLEQALGNVAENAILYAPDDTEVEFTARQEDDQVRIEIADRGPGVAETELPHLFDKFYRAAATARFSGAGLGLSITRGLVEAMGGQVSAHNRAAGAGLVVAVTLPRAA